MGQRDVLEDFCWALGIGFGCYGGYGGRNGISTRRMAWYGSATALDLEEKVTCE